MTGEDAATFLQGQFSNDLRVAVGDAVYGLWLDHTGHVQADSWVLRGSGDVFWVGSYFSPAERIQHHLEGHIIADDVTVEDLTPDWEGITVFGELADGAEFDVAESGVIRFHGRRAAESCWEWVFPTDRGGEIKRKASRAQMLSDADMEMWRIVAGIPAVPLDIGPRDLPHEGGLDASAISYVKGCYLGQEVMARLSSKGRVRRRLHRVRGAGPAPSSPARLYQAGTDVGELRSVAARQGGYCGLALLSMLKLDPKHPLQLTAEPNASDAISLMDGS